jgi:hypothetical protein
MCAGINPIEDKTVLAPCCVFKKLKENTDQRFLCFCQKFNESKIPLICFKIFGFALKENDLKWLICSLDISEFTINSILFYEKVTKPVKNGSQKIHDNNKILQNLPRNGLLWQGAGSKKISTLSLILIFL